MTGRISRLVKRTTEHRSKIIPMAEEDKRFWAEWHRRKAKREQENLPCP